MELGVRDVARLLDVSEQTIYRWIESASLPAHRVHDQYRFNRVELQEWAALHKRKVAAELFAPRGSVDEVVSIEAAIRRGGIYYRVPGDRRETVFEAITQLPGIPAGVNRGLLFQLLVARDALASTAVGDGIALPHPRDPIVVQVMDPVVLLCFLQEPVDFRAPDGQPVRILFTLLSPSIRMHLQLLARLAMALHDATLKELLRTSAPEELILDRFRVIETSAGAAGGRPLDHHDAPAPLPPGEW
jgi:PTS system nitrogen regulatory IIA component